MFRRERRIVIERALELELLHGVELAVERSIEAHGSSIGVSHGSAFRVLASRARPRDNRDITVPIGAPVASAISR